MHRLSDRKFLWGSALPVIIVIVVVAAIFLFRGNPVDPDTYQAVFLTNNQVYFGKLSGIRGRYPVLRDVFYLQLARVLQAQDIKAPPQQEVKLIKLGSELHGPIDEMFLSRDQILFFENLKPDSKVMRSIEEFKHPTAQEEEKR